MSEVAKSNSLFLRIRKDSFGPPEKVLSSSKFPELVCRK